MRLVAVALALSIGVDALLPRISTFRRRSALAISNFDLEEYMARVVYAPRDGIGIEAAGQIVELNLSYYRIRNSFTA
jgi:hypothetical protein